MNSQMMATHGVSGALLVIALWWLKAHNIEVPGEVAVAMGVVGSATGHASVTLWNSYWARKALNPAGAIMAQVRAAQPQA